MFLGFARHLSRLRKGQEQLHRGRRLERGQAEQWQADTQ